MSVTAAAAARARRHARFYVACVALGLDYMHARHLLYRDLKVRVGVALCAPPAAPLGDSDVHCVRRRAGERACVREVCAEEGGGGCALDALMSHPSAHARN